MSYFISPPDETSYEFDADEFAEFLTEWEGLELTWIEDDYDVHVLEWSMPLRHGRLYGALDRTLQVVHIDAFLGDCALFALWLRAHVPASVELLFYDETYSADVALMSFTKEADLMRAFAS